MLQLVLTTTPLYGPFNKAERVYSLEHGLGGRHRRSLVESGPHASQHENREPISLEHDYEHVLDGVEQQAVAEYAEAEAVEAQSQERHVLQHSTVLIVDSRHRPGPVIPPGESV